jgi:hypothetical protein
MRRLAARVAKLRRILPVALFLGLTAHVGSPNVVFDGDAGPYGVRVVVRPPMVVPGRAEVIVRLAASDTARVSIRPVFWRVGAAGSPSADNAPRIPGAANVYTGQIWLMSRGSYGVYVTVNGARGSGTAIVPVTSFATGRLGISKGLAAILVVLGGILFVGLITIVRAATGEALLEPGERMTDATRRRARIATLVATPLLALLVFGGARWWGSVDGDYERTMYRPPAADVSVETTGAAHALSLRIHDTAAFRAISAPVIPDHGKMMHLCVVSAGSHRIFGHFHPSQVDSLHFTTMLSGLPAGGYTAFADVVLANGLSQTVKTGFDWPGDGATTTTDSDEAVWVSDSSGVGSVERGVSLGDGLSTVWTGASRPIAANEPSDLRFEVRDAAGKVAMLAPYLGMAGHAVVMRSDDSVFVHLHPMGTVSVSAQQMFVARDRGDTTTTGGVVLPTADSMPMAMPASLDGHLDFPYEFPKAGRYRVWVQVRARPGTRVLTGAFDLDVR